jgi:hypothetical protein
MVSAINVSHPGMVLGPPFPEAATKQVVPPEEESWEEAGLVSAEASWDMELSMPSSSREVST